MDYHINDKHTLFGRWIDDYNSILVANGPGGNIPITPEIRDRPAKVCCSRKPGLSRRAS